LLQKLKRNIYSAKLKISLKVFRFQSPFVSAIGWIIRQNIFRCFPIENCFYYWMYLLSLLVIFIAKIYDQDNRKIRIIIRIIGLVGCRFH